MIDFVLQWHNGVTLAAIQELDQQNQQLAGEVRQLRLQVVRLQRAVKRQRLGRSRN